MIIVFCSKEIKRLQHEVEEIQAELDEFYNKDKSRTPLATPRSRRASSHAAASPVRSRVGYVALTASYYISIFNSSATTIMH